MRDSFLKIVPKEDKWNLVIFRLIENRSKMKIMENSTIYPNPKCRGLPHLKVLAPNRAGELLGEYADITTIRTTKVRTISPKVLYYHVESDQTGICLSQILLHFRKERIIHAWDKSEENLLFALRKEETNKMIRWIKSLKDSNGDKVTLNVISMNELLEHHNNSYKPAEERIHVYPLSELERLMGFKGTKHMKEIRNKLRLIF